MGITAAPTFTCSLTLLAPFRFVPFIRFTYTSEIFGKVCVPLPSSSVVFHLARSQSLSRSFILSIHVLCAWMLLLNPHIRHTGCLCASLPLYMAFIITTNSNTTTTLDYYQILLANSNVRFKTIYYYTDSCAPFIRTYLAQSHCLLHTPWLLCAYSNSNNKSNRKTHW